jgi:hypothetical protein
VSRICPVCHQESPDEARYCFDPACLSPLDPPDEAPPAPIGPPPEEERRRVPPWAWGAGAVGLAAVAGGVVLAVGSLGGSAAKAPPPSTTVVVTTVAQATTGLTPTTLPATTVPVRGTALDPAKIVSSEASSTLPDQDGLTYGIANTLDGQVTTAWNSNGSTPGSGVPPEGQKLTYKLAAPQHIIGVRFLNGFNPNDGKHQFTDNHRVRMLAIRGGGHERQVELADSFAPQFVEVDLPNTDTVELEIVSVYPTTKWPDVGLTEVQFFVGP